MRWSPAIVVETEGAATALQPSNRAVRHGSQVLGADSITIGDAELTSEVEWRMRFYHPSTLTDEEARELFGDFLSTLAAEPARSFALAKCVAIFGGLPGPIIPTVLEQLEEIAEYELRLWHVRQEEPKRIEERTSYLPAGK